MNANRLWMHLGIVAALWTSAAVAEPMTFHPTDDTTITNGSPDYHYGALSEMDVRNRYGGGGSSTWEADALIKFDLSSIPAGTSISSAMLNIYYYSDQGGMDPGGRPLNCYRLAGNWNEEDVTWNTQPGHVSTLTCYSVVPSAPGVWMQWNVTSDVQAFVQGSLPNCGWDILDERPWSYYDIPLTRFRTKEFGAFVPYLTVVPEPTTVVLALAGLVNLVARGRRH